MCEAEYFQTNDDTDSELSMISKDSCGIMENFSTFSEHEKFHRFFPVEDTR